MQTERFCYTKGTLAVLQCLKGLNKMFQVFNNEDILQRMEIRSTVLCSILSIFHADDLSRKNTRCRHGCNIQILGKLCTALYKLCMVTHRCRKKFRYLASSPLQGNVRAGTQFWCEAQENS